MNMLLAAIKTDVPWLDALLGAVLNFINPMLIVVAVAGVIYAIVVGFKFVKADNKEERGEAKQKLITVIIGIVVTFVLIAVFFFLAYNIGPGKMLDPSNLGLI